MQAGWASISNLIGGWCVAKKSQIQGKERERENKKVGSFVGVCFTSMEGIAWGLPYPDQWLTHKGANLSEDSLEDENQRWAAC